METGAKVWRKPKPSFRCGPWVPRRNSVELRPRHALKMLYRVWFAAPLGLGAAMQSHDSLKE
ncbi:hypothetical protein DVH24_009747 [Malus domestica]|uniref:Uncharacterized protein n=1 Tax=Malus domestica TaxID=3750 RepID=A0A498JP51_MALDO|nr:hypothetical protein DVH24_009747 [Malus domestica]